MTTIPTTISELAGQTEASEVSIRTTRENDPVHFILEGINDYEIDSDRDDSLHELCDSLVDVYTSDLHEWVGRADHGTYVSQAVQEGIADTSDFERMIMAGQYEWYMNIAQEVIEWLEEKLEEMYEDGFPISAYYTDDSGLLTEEGVSKETLEENVLVAVQEEQGDGLFIVTADPDDAEYIFDTHIDSERGEFSVAAREAMEA